MTKLIIYFLAIFASLALVSIVAAQDEKNKPNNVTVVDGESCRAITVACTAFLADPKIPEQKKDLKNYKVWAYFENGFINVSFLTKFEKNVTVIELERMGNDSPTTVAVTYVIDPVSFSVKKSYFNR
jgi:hypothetical protein